LKDLSKTVQYLKICPRAKLRFEVLFKKFHPRINLTTLPPKHDKTIFKPMKISPWGQNCIISKNLS
jgi:hypothetical protein